MDSMTFDSTASTYANDVNEVDYMKEGGTRSLLDVSLSSFGYTFVFIFLLFENPLETLIPSLTYFDEFLFFFLVCAALLKMRFDPVIAASEEFKIVLCALGIVVTGLIGNWISGYQTSMSVIAKDVFVFLKFPLTLIAMIQLMRDVNTRDTAHLCSIVSSIFIIVSFFTGIANIISPIDTMAHDFRNGIWSFKFIYSHPTFLVYALTISFVMISVQSKKFSIIKLMCIITMVLTMRDKALAFVGFFIAMRVLKIGKRRRILFKLLLAGVVALAIVLPKVVTYMSYSNSPRQALYSASLAIASDFFPFGSGFSTIACSLSSGEHYSKAYLIYGMSDMKGLDPVYPTAVGDAGLAYYLGEFGIIGITLMVIMMIYIYRVLVKRLSLGSARRDAILLLFGYILVALAVEAVLTNATGVMSAIVFSYIASISEMKCDTGGCYVTRNR